MQDTCRHFRDRFEPGMRDPHRDRCADCSRFAEILEGTAVPEARRPMSLRLRERLRDIPRHEVTCRDEDRLYRATRRAAQRGEVPWNDGEKSPSSAPDADADDHAARHHLRTCSRCRDLYGTLYCAMVPEHQPMSQRLARRIGSIARHPERLLPPWIRDTRYAAAACYLLASLTLALADDASAIFSRTTAKVSPKAIVWTESGEARGTDAWNTMSSTLSGELSEGWHRVQHYSERGERLLLDALRATLDTTQQLIPGPEGSVEGDDHG
ncbi:MAG: hypothetical protein AAF657_22315 [Acidobacteriota bacterium]